MRLVSMEFFERIPDDIQRISREISSLRSRAKDIGEEAVAAAFTSASELIDLDKKIFGATFTNEGAVTSDVDETSGHDPDKVISTD